MKVSGWLNCALEQAAKEEERWKLAVEWVHSGLQRNGWGVWNELSLIATRILLAYLLWQAVEEGQ